MTRATPVTPPRQRPSKVRSALQYLSIVLISALLFLAIDWMAGDSLARLVQSDPELRYRLRDDYLHHTLLPNFRTDTAHWGNKDYTLCTDKHGYKQACDAAPLPNPIDLAFIGDSFTEGIGMPYKHSFVGLVARAAQRSEQRVVNLAVASYSPIIYYHKLEQAFARGLQIKHVVALIDISDIQDEAAIYMDCGGYVCTRYDSLTWARLAHALPRHFPTSFELGRSSKRLWSRVKQLFKGPKRIPTIFKRDYDRSAWTYNPNIHGYGDMGVAGGIGLALNWMRRTHALLKKHGAELSVGVYPWPAQLLHDKVDSRQVHIWQRFCQEQGCKHFINLFPLFFDKLGRQKPKDIIATYYIPGDVHFNRRGNALIATELIDELQLEATEALAARER